MIDLLIAVDHFPGVSVDRCFYRIQPHHGILAHKPRLDYHFIGNGAPVLTLILHLYI
jgi:hypothetical protein